MKLVCIDDFTDKLKIGDGIKELTFGKQYHIDNHYTLEEDGREFISIINDKGISNDYLVKRFITLEDFRDLKLSELGIN